METKHLQEPLAGIAARGRIEAEDVLALRRAFYADGVITRAEADALFELAHACQKQCAEWQEFFVEAVTDFIVHQEKPRGYISQENADWLMRAISDDAMVTSMVELELLVRALEKAKYSPESLSAFALRQVTHAVVDAKGPLMIGGQLVPGLVAKSEVELLRRILYAFGGEGNIAVSRDEAEILFQINERTAGAGNDPSWNDLFVKAIANFVMGSSGYEVPTRAEALKRDAFFENSDPHVGGFLARMLSGGLRGILNSYKAPGADADWETRNRVDEARARRAETIDGGEAKWLAERIGRDGKIDDNEKALLAFLKQASPEIHPALKPLLDKVA